MKTIEKINHIWKIYRNMKTIEIPTIHVGKYTVRPMDDMMGFLH